MNLGVNVMYDIRSLYLRSVLLLVGFAALLLIQTLELDSGSAATPAIGGTTSSSPH